MREVLLTAAALWLAAKSGEAAVQGTFGGPAESVSPFVGSYSAAFTTASEQSGTTSLTVDADGDVSGTVSNTTISAQGPVSGTISNSGDADITFTYTGLGSARLRGTITLRASDNRLVGNLTQSANGVQTDTVSVSLGRLD